MATLETSVFEKKEIEAFSKRSDYENLMNRRKDFLLEDEIKYGYHLLSRDYIQICTDDRKTRIDMDKVFASIHQVEVRDYVLNKFQYFYQNISRVSDADEEMKKYLKRYNQLCLKEEIPSVDYQGELLDCDVLMEQIDMYVRYHFAREKFLLNHVNLVHMVCRQIFKKEMDYDDLFMSSYVGLINAVWNYDVRFGNVFSTYGVIAIVNAATRYIRANSSMIRTPDYIGKILYKIDDYKNHYFSVHHDYPTDLEIANELGLSVDSIKEIKQKSLEYKCLFLEQKMFGGEEEGPMVLGDIVADKNSDFVNDMVENDWYQRMFQLLANHLSDRELQILLKRADGKTLDAIGLEYCLSRQKIEQLEKKARKKSKKF